MTTRIGTTIPLERVKMGRTRPYSFVDLVGDVERYKAAKMTLRQIAREVYGGRVTHAVIQRVEQGHEPKDPNIRMALGLPAFQALIAPRCNPGAVVLAASKPCANPACPVEFVPVVPWQRFCCAACRGARRE